ncbi:MAG: ilvD 3 [Firmicutes bacterium]|nr:ilvD 3 [Bacillota bacterium]
MSCGCSRSQNLRKVNYQGDGLRAGMQWEDADLGKLQILIDTVHGDSHPGSSHLGGLADEAKIGVYESMLWRHPLTAVFLWPLVTNPYRRN